MARPNPIRTIMATPLPGITYQRRKSFRPADADIIYAYNIINKYVFDGVLRRPSLQQGTLRKAWGYCSWEHQEQQNGSWCNIQIMNKWFCPQWFMNTLAHEMVHQWQWDILRWDHLEIGKEMYIGSGAHGPSFFQWRDRFDYYGLNLKRFHRMKKWFAFQDFTRC